MYSTVTHCFCDTFCYISLPPRNAFIVHKSKLVPVWNYHAATTYVNFTLLPPNTRSTHWIRGWPGSIAGLHMMADRIIPFPLSFIMSKSKSHYDRRSVSQFVVVSCPPWSKWPDVTFIWGTITFFIFPYRAPSLTRGRVCNLQCNDATSISSYIATDGVSSSDFNFFVWQLLRLLGVGLPHPYPPWTYRWESFKSANPNISP
jgi:hypothetical protein